MLGHGYNVLPGVGQINRALPRHNSEHVERKKNAGRVNLAIGAVEEIGNHFGALHFTALRFRRMLGCWLPFR